MGPPAYEPGGGIIGTLPGGIAYCGGGGGATGMPGAYGGALMPG